VQGLVLAGAVSLVAAGCGGNDSKEPQKVAVKVTEAGKGQYTIAAPENVKAGAVELSLDNSAAQAPHAASLIKLEDGHTVKEALPIINSNGPPQIPDWLRAEGGVGETKPGESNSATVKLDAGHYVLLDDAENGAKQAPYAEFDVSGDAGGDLPGTDAKVTAAETGTDKYEWQVDGLKAGVNEFTFVAEGKDALHHIVAMPIKGNATIDDVKSELESQQQGPPQTLDFQNGVQTSVIDGGKDEVTKFNLKAGRYAFICFLPDRDKPDKPHFEEGLLKEVTVGS
jgi:hypothetical protein